MGRTRGQGAGVNRFAGCRGRRQMIGAASGRPFRGASGAKLGAPVHEEAVVVDEDAVVQQTLAFGVALLLTPGSAALVVAAEGFAFG